jgi:hypothetical protein
MPIKKAACCFFSNRPLIKPYSISLQQITFCLLGYFHQAATNPEHFAF